MALEQAPKPTAAAHRAGNLGELVHAPGSQLSVKLAWQGDSGSFCLRGSTVSKAREGKDKRHIPALEIISTEREETRKKKVPSCANRARSPAVGSS